VNHTSRHLYDINVTTTRAAATFKSTPPYLCAVSCCLLVPRCCCSVPWNRLAHPISTACTLAVAVDCPRPTSRRTAVMAVCWPSRRPASAVVPRRPKAAARKSLEWPVVAHKSLGWPAGDHSCTDRPAAVTRSYRRTSGTRPGR